MSRPIKILAISGSLRANSSNAALVRAIAKLVPSHVDYMIYNNMHQIPLFNECDDPPESIGNLRNLLTSADGVFICSPEYAFGVSGVLKNAIDWTVSSGEFFDKPVAVITGAVNGEKAHASLLLILEAISAKVVEGGTLLIPFVRTKLDKNDEITDISTLLAIKKVINALISTIS